MTKVRCIDCKHYHREREPDYVGGAGAYISGNIMKVVWSTCGHPNNCDMGYDPVYGEYEFFKEKELHKERNKEGTCPLFAPKPPEPVPVPWYRRIFKRESA